MSVSGTAVDPVVAASREEIDALDRRVLETLNERLARVRTLRAYKRDHGLAFVDPEREARLVAELQRSNPGPLSDAGVADLARFVLDLVKRELVRDA